MAEQGGGGSSVNMVAILAILVLVGLAAWFFMGQRPRPAATAPPAAEQKSDIEVKVDGPEFWRIGPALLKAIQGYAGRFGVMSFDPRIARWLKTNAPTIRRGLVVRDRLPAFKRWAAMTIADPHFLAIDIAALHQPWVAKARARMPLYSWTSRTRADGKRVRQFADAAIWEADGRG